MFIRFLILVLFIAGMILVGVLTRRKIKSTDDFILGGGRLGSWFTAFAYGTTYFSAVVFIGYAGSISWKFGLSSVWIGIGNAIIGTMLAWLVLGRRTFRFMKAAGAKTMPEFFEKRYNSKLLKLLSTLIIFIFLVPYTASVYTGLGILFDRAFSINLTTVVLIMGLLTAAYLVMGGYLATATNDFIQGIIMLAGIIVITCMIIFNPEIGGFSGGMAELARQAAAEGNTVALNSPFSFDINLVSLIIMTSLGTWGLPQMAHKFYAIKDERSIKQATVISTVFALIIAGGSYLVGTFGRVYMKGIMPTQNGVPNGDLVVPRIMDTVLGGKGMFGDIMYGIIAVVVLSASMSTLAGLVLTSSSTFTMDFLKGGVAPKLKEKQTVQIMRGLCIVFIAVSIAITVKKVDMIVNLMSYSWGAIAGAFIGPFVWGVCSKGVNKQGAYVSFITGIGITLLGLFKVFGNLPPYVIGALSIVSSLIVTPTASFVYNLVAKPKTAETPVLEN